ncbi:MAG: phosphomethylpyrimidine synthase ThiC [Planctomycetaceae bacterium]|jgi:phosphomethylpyrimidine synthase|nr:phosphomethylpyrimidine synthase ThiC [Planctomycetaceae bacterium]
MTQYLEARAGHITPEMLLVAEQEFLEPELIRQEIAAGHLVIPANKIHLTKKLCPIGIGMALRTKINANLGNSALTSDSCCEIAKVQDAIRYGADTVMDLSTGAEIDLLRQRIIDEVTVPVGTVPLYQVCEQLDDILDMTPQHFLDAVEHQARQGVDYMTIHAGLLQKHLPLIERRLAGIVSRGGSLTAKWMVAHQRENPFYEHFDDLCEIMKTYDVCWSIGDGLRPGCLHDASDAAQFGELEVMGQLAVRAWEIGCQVMIEGPGHIPLDQIEMNIKRQIEECCGAPFYVLGPVVCDIAPGYDHITSAIGATLAAFHGAAMLCYVTPKEHLGLPDREDVRQGVIAYKIAAHAADVARQRPHARERDDALSRARFAFDWEEQFRLSLDPERAREYYQVSRTVRTKKEMTEDGVAEHNTNCPNPNNEPEKYCTMCGPKFCAMKTTQELKLLQQKK